jgi:signal transduction histidine kinase
LLLHRPPRSVRLRLTALYGVLFLACGAALLTVTYVLVRHSADGNLLTYQDSSSRVAVALFGADKPAVAGKYERSVTRSGPASRPLPKDAAKTIAEIRRLARAQQQDMLNQLLLDSGIALGVMAVLSCGLGWVVAGRTLRPLETSLAAQRQFVANASHELRTPLARQRAIGQVALADPEADAGSLRAAHERVLAAGAQQERLIAGLLALARGQAGVDHTEPLDLGAVVQRAVAHRRPEADLRGIVVTAELGDAPLRGDPRLVESLVGNLVDNAVRHNVPDGWLDIGTAVVDGRAVLTVGNSGPLLDSAELPRLLEPFRRRDGARPAGQDGFGIGLSIVRAVCDAHRATLELRPRPEGGLAVAVAFPAAAPGPEARGDADPHPADRRRFLHAG